MIYTVTFNPAIDYVVRLDTPLEVGEVNRAKGEDCVLGGKGINVSGRAGHHHRFYPPRAGNDPHQRQDKGGAGD